MHFVVKPTGVEMFQFLFFFEVSFGVLLISLVYVRLWWFCLLYRLWTHFGGFAYGTGWFQLGSVSASGLTLVVLLNIPPLDSLNHPVP